MMIVEVKSGFRNCLICSMERPSKKRAPFSPPPRISETRRTEESVNQSNSRESSITEEDALEKPARAAGPKKSNGKTRENPRKKMG